MSGEDVTKPRELKLFQKQLGVLVDDAEYCLTAARDRFDEPKLYRSLVPVAQAAVWDAAEVIEDQAVTIGNFSDERVEEFSIPTLILQLKSMCDRFERALEALGPESNVPTILETCAVATGEIRRAVIALENRMSRLVGVPPSRSLATDLENGLKLRRLFVRFDRALRGLDENPKRLELVPKLLDNLKSSKAWKHARAIDQWRMSEQIGLLDSNDGTWDGIKAFSLALVQIRWRVEICEHDLALIEQVLDSVLDKSVGSSIDEAFLTGVEPIRYFSDDLDDIFQRGTSSTYGEWKYQLEMAADLISRNSDRAADRKTSEMGVLE